MVGSPILLIHPVRNPVLPVRRDSRDTSSHLNVVLLPSSCGASRFTAAQQSAREREIQPLSSTSTAVMFAFITRLPRVHSGTSPVTPRGESCRYSTRGIVGVESATCPPTALIVFTVAQCPRGVVHGPNLCPSPPMTAAARVLTLTQRAESLAAIPGAVRHWILRLSPRWAELRGCTASTCASALLRRVEAFEGQQRIYV
ncbi:hypothetical protein B0H10DRAFT_2429996 [Mycena sp. CBHHK59/15]|nr:hypothetical protein B0H10DRAFT_2429996 [Mycena sp. CBHHK59/15]